MPAGMTVDAWDQHGPLFGHVATKPRPSKAKAERRAASKRAKASRRRNR